MRRVDPLNGGHQGTIWPKMTGNSELGNLIELPPELIRALGEVSARYGQIEYLLTMTICRATQLSYDEAFAKVEELRSRPEVRKEAKRCFKDWATKKFSESEGLQRCKEFDDLIQAWDDLAKRRADVIHCCWSVGVADKRPSGRRKGKPLRTKDGDAFGFEEVAALGEDLKHFVVQLNRATLPDTLSGRAEEIAAIPAKFSPGFVVGRSIETASTMTAVFKPSFVSAGPIDD